MLRRLHDRLWVLQYRVEEVRQLAHYSGHLWRQVGACIALSILRLFGG